MVKTIQLIEAPSPEPKRGSGLVQRALGSFRRGFYTRSASRNAQLARLGNGKRVLVVDDDAVIRETTSLKLAAAGYQVATAADCSEAIEAVGKERPDVILVDLSFPPDVASGGGISWDGFRLMYWLRGLENSRGAQFIIITSSCSADVEKKALAGGAAAFFIKPIDHRRLLEVIAQETGLLPGGKRSVAADFQI